MRSLGIATLALLTTSCAAEPANPGEGAQERMDEATRALEQEGYESTFAFHVSGDGPWSGATNVLPAGGTAAIFAWCEGGDEGPSVNLDDVDIGTIPCSEEGEANQIVDDYAYSGMDIQLQGTDGSRTSWALAVGFPPGDAESDQAQEEVSSAIVRISRSWMTDPGGIIW